MQTIDYYGEHTPTVSGSVQISTEDAERLVGLIRELRELTQSRASYSDASRLIAQLTGEREENNLVSDDLLPQ